MCKNLHRLKSPLEGAPRLVFRGERLFCFPISFQRKKSQRAPRAYQSVRSTAYLMSPKPGLSAMREPNEAHRRRKEAVPIPGTPQIARFRSLGSRSERDPLTPPAPPAMESSATGCRSALRRPSHSGLPKRNPNLRWRYLSVGGQVYAAPSQPPRVQASFCNFLSPFLPQQLAKRLRVLGCAPIALD